MQTKLKLHLEDLTVDSFDTTRVERPKGTVFGEQCTCYTQCTCPRCPTCDASCNGTCGGTCEVSCNGTCAGASCDSCVGSCPCYTYVSECNWLATCLEPECGGLP